MKFTLQVINIPQFNNKIYQNFKDKLIFEERGMTLNGNIYPQCLSVILQFFGLLEPWLLNFPFFSFQINFRFVCLFFVLFLMSLCSGFLFEQIEQKNSLECVARCFSRLYLETILEQTSQLRNLFSRSSN